MDIGGDCFEGVLDDEFLTVEIFQISTTTEASPVDRHWIVKAYMRIPKSSAEIIKEDNLHRLAIYVNE